MYIREDFLEYWKQYSKISGQTMKIVTWRNIEEEVKNMDQIQKT